MHLSRTKLLSAIIILATMLASFVLSAVPAAADGPMYTMRERHGFAFITHLDTPDGWEDQSLGDYNVAPLQAGWYSDWTFRATPAMPADTTVEYAQLIRVADGVFPPDWQAVENAVSLNPGAVWMIGNEPECPNQDAVTPEAYAGRYEETYARIKGWDPTARIAIGAIVEPTPLRFLWLEEVMAAYELYYGEEMPVDIWNIHIQILSEGSDSDTGYNTKAGAGIPVGIDYQAAGVSPRQYSLQDCANVQVLQNMVLDFRDWMLENGQADKPLIISEMGVLMPSIYLVDDDGSSEEERAARGDLLVEDFMVDAFDWLSTATDSTVGCPADENRLVQRWLWFSLNDAFYWDDELYPHGFNGALYDYQTKQPTRFGTRYIAIRQGTAVCLPLVLR